MLFRHVNFRQYLGVKHDMSRSISFYKGLSIYDPAPAVPPIRVVVREGRPKNGIAADALLLVPPPTAHNQQPRETPNDERCHQERLGRHHPMQGCRR